MPTAPTTPSRVSPVAGLLLVVVFWAGNFTATKVAFTEVPPLAFTGLRFALASVVLWLVVRRVEGIEPIPRQYLPHLVALGVIGNSIYQLLFVLGLDKTAVTKSALILAILPIGVTIGAAVLGIEHVTTRQRIAVLVSTIGVILVLLARGGTIGGGIGVGEIMLLLAVIAWTAYTLMLRRWALPISTLRITAWTVYTGTPLLVLAGIPGALRTDWSSVSLVGWGGILYSALLSLVVAYVLWNRAVTTLGASRTAVYNSLVPFVSALIAFVVLGERPGPLHVVGGLLIIAGVILANQATAPEG